MLTSVAAVYEPVQPAILWQIARRAGLTRGAGDAELAEAADGLLADGVLSRPGASLGATAATCERVARELNLSGTWDRVAEATALALPTRRSPRGASFEEMMRPLRLGFYAGRPDQVARAYEALKLNRRTEVAALDPLERLLEGGGARWLEKSSAAQFTLVVPHLLERALLRGGKLEPWTGLIKRRLARGFDPPPEVAVLYAWALVVSGELEEAAALAEGDGEGEGEVAGLLGLAQRMPSEAVDAFRRRLSVIRGADAPNRVVCMGTVSDLAYPLALLGLRTKTSLQRARAFVNGATKRSPLSGLLGLRALSLFTAGEEGAAASRPLVKAELGRLRAEHGPYLLLTWGLVAQWLAVDLPKSFVDALEASSETLEDNGWAWLAAELRDLPSPSGASVLLELRPGGQAWERTLLELERLAGVVHAPGKDEERLVWVLATGLSGRLEIEPRLQKRSGPNKWSAGRRAGLERLAKGGDDLPWLTLMDRRVCQAIETVDLGRTRRGKTQHELDARRAVPLLVGHPHVYWTGEWSVPVTVRRERPRLHVSEPDADGAVSVWLDPATADDVLEDVLPGDPSIRITTWTEQTRNLAKVLRSRDRFPSGAWERLSAVVGGLADVVDVHSGAGVVTSRDVTLVTADLRPRVQLRPAGQGLKARVVIAPLGPDGPRYPPGDGAAAVVATVAGQRVQTERDLREERRVALHVFDLCPTLSHWAIDGGEALIVGLQDSLQLVSELKGLGEQVSGEEVVVEWPEGKALEVLKTATAEDLKVQIRRKSDWFVASGELHVDDGMVLQMGVLLEALRVGTTRFVELDEGRYVELTEALRTRLAELDRLRMARRGKLGTAIPLHPLAALAMGPLWASAGQLDIDDHYEAFKGRVAEAEALRPELPRTLEAELRPYQIEGFEWLSRLACMEAAACLADDMGLGKTVQALALMLQRAPDGPQLVIAPTSVIANWVDQGLQFAPTLRISLLERLDRQGQVEALGPFDVLVTSYGLLQHSGEALEGVTWQTVVLDEAQAIKNATTKRAKAAKALRAKFRLVTTGTPIENRLDELWSLFEFLLPGLLGTRGRFDKTFGRPIERDGDDGARKALRRLVRPFILRRTKSQVLADLPPRTDVVLRIEPGPEEAAFYEAVRLRAESASSAAASHDPTSMVHVLAEITRLRRAACHPLLVDPSAPFTAGQGAKLMRLAELLETLTAEGHRALVFSQFVGHLTLARQVLEQRGISYLYLDGSTPRKQRDSTVREFQSGVGDAFLISLKAGGVGLNLTGADYVVHLDPWWNPAVEDQASDRAHRIGQTRPVTVYRLVTRGTIEERITDELHRSKRKLAEELLAGSETVTRLSLADLVALMGR